MEKFRIAIVGSGPAGLSAAGRAAETGVSHVLLEATPNLSNTVTLYQKGKFVMAEPNALPLRASVPFEAGSRESILDAWYASRDKLNINVRFGAEVTGIAGTRGNFSLALANGDSVEAEFVVLAIGFQGNLRKLEIAGGDAPCVQYQLDDPDEYLNESIVVIGAGDSAIENALALATQNAVTIVNRRDDFDRAKEGNLTAIKRGIDKGQIDCRYSAAPARLELVDPKSNEGRPARLYLKTPTGEAAVSCDRVIARLGATPPRKFIESIGIVFPNQDPNTVPIISAQYESNVPGVYLIGALAGCPLIKQAMNQGYEVVEYIEGRAVEPADEEALRGRLQGIPGFLGVAQVVQMVKERIPLFAELTTLQIREFLLYSTVRVLRGGDILIKKDDFPDSFFSILKGAVNIEVDSLGSSTRLNIKETHFLGESTLTTNRRWPAIVAAAEETVIIETPRRSMKRLVNSVDAIRVAIEKAFLARLLRRLFAGDGTASDFEPLIDSAVVETFGPGKPIFQEGDAADRFYVIRSGSVTISRQIGGREVVLSYVPAGQYIPDISLLTGTDSKRAATARAAILTECVALDLGQFSALLGRFSAVKARLQRELYKQFGGIVQTGATGYGGMTIIDFIGKHGLGEATNVLLIDEALCVSCDNCEKACADTHHGISRLDREAGPNLATIHVPTSCRHCEHPHCMKDCPPDALSRAANGEILINQETCIGCGNCERNCPYGVIQMAGVEEQAPKKGLIWDLLFGSKSQADTSDDHSHQKKAVKCDMCSGLPHGPACVRACPTGAAMRVSPQEFMDVVQRARASVRL